MSETDLIIFDWDDTIAEGATPAYLDCYHHALVGVDVNLDPAVERKLITDQLGSTDIEIIKSLIDANGDKLAAAKLLYDQWYENTFVASVKAVAGSSQFLDRLHSMGKHTLAIASGVNPETLKNELMPKFGIDPAWFAKIYTAYDIEDPSKVKPHPHSVEVIIEELGIKRANTVVVGDSRNDVAMARDAGVEPVVVLTGNLTRRQALDMGVNAKCIIKDVTRLEPVLDQLALN